MEQLGLGCGGYEHGAEDGEGSDEGVQVHPVVMLDWMEWKPVQQLTIGLDKLTRQKEQCGCTGKDKTPTSTQNERQCHLRASS